MTESHTSTSESKRRPIIKGVGIGAVMPLLSSGVGMAQQSSEDSESSETPSVEVVPWDKENSREFDDIDTDDTFSARIEVSGLEPPTHIAYMVAPFNSVDKFGGKERVHAQDHEITSDPDPIVHSNWNPSGFLHEWTEGDYRLVATVVDENLELVGRAVSDTFRIE